MNKIEIVQKLNLDELGILCEKIFNKIDLVNVKRLSNNVIEALQNTELEQRELFFVLSLNELAGKDDEIKKTINTINSRFGNFYLISVNKKKTSSYFQEWIKKEFPQFQFIYWDTSNIVDLIEKHIPLYWSHSDVYIVPYEEYFYEKLKNDIEIRSLLKLDKKFDAFLDIFIEPKISTFAKDKETGSLIRKPIEKNRIVKSGSYILSGEAGTGKTTLLKHIGKNLIENNRIFGEKNIPILIKTGDLSASKYDLNLTISNILLKVYKEFDLDFIYQNYKIILLLDSIDEFEKEIQINIIDQICNLSKNHEIRFVISTRNYQYLLKECKINDHIRLEINNFNLKQVKNFLDNFFKFDTLKADKLWKSLQENNILDRIPITPLTLSILSILYEERQYEIPATITDVYDNFNLFLLGKTTVKSNLEFIDLNIKERILSLYALQIIQNLNKEKKTKSEFSEFISEFFRTRNKISDPDLPELVNSLTQGTGILFLDDDDKISFKHDYFMEYYASLEIFKQRRDLESELIKKFTNFNWQNTAIFYAGRTKDMPEFLKKLLEESQKYSNLSDCLIATSGIGYILQALWLTDANLRKEGISNALNLLVKSDEKIKEYASQKFPFFENIKIPDIALLNLFWFYQHYNSVTLKESLSILFEELIIEHKKESQSAFSSNKNTILFKMFCVALTLATGVNNSNEKLEKLLNISGILNNPLYVILFEIAFEMLGQNPKQLKKEIGIDKRKKKYWEGINFYIKNPAEKLRFTNWDNIQPNRDIEIYTEGKTDALIIKHAHDVLTSNSSSYWNIRFCGNLKNGSGGAHELSKFLTSLAPKLDNKVDNQKIVIGLFDNDEKGNQEFKGLKPIFFDSLDQRLKKHKEVNIYAMKLPIPPDKEHYIKEKQTFNFFAIEHYLPIEFLKVNEIVTETDLPDIYEIIPDKVKVASIITKDSDANNFLDFKFLFDQFDKISGRKTIYNE